MLHAYVDESGVSGEASRSSKHFVLGAFIFDASDGEQRALDLLAELRRGIGRQAGHHLHWNQIQAHGSRRYLTQTIGEQDWCRLSTVIVCREHIPDSLPNPQVRYQFTLRFLLERLSWFARAKRTVLHCTISHWIGLQESELRTYEAQLRRSPGNIAFEWLDPAGIAIADNRSVELLQLADIVASSTATAFERDKWGFVEPDYLRRTLPRFYRHENLEGEAKLLSYGLKLHPNSAANHADYSWVLDHT